MTISIIRILPALAVTAFAAAACSSGEAAERWSVSNSQIGPVTARTAFDRDTLAGLLPGFDVAEASWGGDTALDGSIDYPRVPLQTTKPGQPKNIVFIVIDLIFGSFPATSVGIALKSSRF